MDHAPDMALKEPEVRRRPLKALGSHSGLTMRIVHVLHAVGVGDARVAGDGGRAVRCGVHELCGRLAGGWLCPHEGGTRSLRDEFIEVCADEVAPRHRREACRGLAGRHSKKTSDAAGMPLLVTVLFRGLKSCAHP